MWSARGYFAKVTEGQRLTECASMFSLADFEAHAGAVLDRNAWNYYSSGANQEQTLRDNEEAFKR